MRSRTFPPAPRSCSTPFSHPPERFVVESPIRRRGLLLGYKLTPGRLARVVPLASGAVAVIIVAATANGVVNPNWDDAANYPTGIAFYTPAPVGTNAAEALPSGAPTLPVSPDPSPSLVGTPAPPTPKPIAGAGWIVGVVGDSVMASAVPGLQAETSRRGWFLVDAARPSCPVGYDPLFDNGGAPSPGQGKCDVVQSLHDQLLAAKPDVVIWHDLQSVLARKTANGQILLPGTSAWKADLFRGWSLVLDRFLGAGIPVVIVLPPQRSQETLGCQGVADQARCMTIQQQDALIRQATRDWFASLDGRSGVYLIQVDSLLCPHGVPCPEQNDGIDVRLPGYDQTHFSAAGSVWFAPRLLDEVVAALKPGAATPAPGATS